MSSFNVALIVRIILCLPFVELGTEYDEISIHAQEPIPEVYLIYFVASSLIILIVIKSQNNKKCNNVLQHTY